MQTLPALSQKAVDYLVHGAECNADLVYGEIARRAADLGICDYETALDGEFLCGMTEAELLAFVGAVAAR